MANLIKKYFCTNFGNCKTANTKAMVEIADGEEQICPECKKRMLVPAKTGSNKMLFIIIGAVLVLAGVGAAIFLLGGDKEEKVSNQETTTVAPSAEPTGVTGEPVVEPKEPTTPVKPTVTNGNGSIDLGYAVYTGAIKNGKPHGNGTLEYKQSHKIISNKDYVASPGEKFIGTFREGKINMGTWYQKDGNEVVIKQ